MLKFYENEYSFVKIEKLRIYLTNEFKYCTLTCTLVRGGNKRLFPHTAKWTCSSGRRGILSIVDSIKTLKPSALKSGVTPCWLVQVCFLPNLVSFHPYPQCDCMSKRGNKYILRVSLFRELLRVM